MDKKITRIIVRNVSKKFNLDSNRKESILFKLSKISSTPNKNEIQVLKDISFEVKAGEIIGIIGKNGCGKSTLLRIIAEVYFPDSGEVKTDGKVTYLTAMGQGLIPKLTMRENIFLMGSIMGLSQEDIGKRFDEIVEFSGLKEFVDTKVYQFSTGMVTRLGFSVTIHCLKHQNPDIILLDEVFGSGGDINFHEKAIAKMEELIKGGATVILVSHSLDIIEKYCHRVILIDNGGIKKVGGPEEVIKSYEEMSKK